MNTVQLRATMAWWVLPYAQVLVAWWRLTGREPSERHIAWIVDKGVRIERNYQVPPSHPARPPQDKL